jgi:hypothetical protein
MTRLLLANLHGEAVLAARRRERATGDDELGLPRSLLQRLSATGTLLRVLCRPEDRLWTPLPVDPSCLAVVDGWEAPVLLAGEPPRPAPGEEVVPWMASPVGTCVPEAAIDVAARVCHRRFGLDLAADMGLALPGARMLSSRSELSAHVADGGAAAAPSGRWVLKPPWSAAGRGQLVSPPEADPVPPRWWEQLEQAFAWHGELLFEPWLDRVHDLGTAGDVRDSGVSVQGSHGLVVGARGRFAGVEVHTSEQAGAQDTWPAGLTPALAERLADVARSVGHALAAAGYCGPFGVDAFTHRKISGEVALQPLCEINARLTFGRVAAEWLAVVAAASNDRGCSGRLLFARGPIPAEAERQVGRVIPLLQPDPSHARGGTSAWLEVWQTEEPDGRSGQSPGQQ